MILEEEIYDALDTIDLQRNECLDRRASPSESCTSKNFLIAASINTKPPLWFCVAILFRLEWVALSVKDQDHNKFSLCQCSSFLENKIHNCHHGNKWLCMKLSRNDTILARVAQSGTYPNGHINPYYRDVIIVSALADDVSAQLWQRSLDDAWLCEPFPSLFDAHRWRRSQPLRNPWWREECC